MEFKGKAYRVLNQTDSQWDKRFIKLKKKLEHGVISVCLNVIFGITRDKKNTNDTIK